MAESATVFDVSRWCLGGYDRAESRRAGKDFGKKSREKWLKKWLRAAKSGRKTERRVTELLGRGRNVLAVRRCLTRPGSCLPPCSQQDQGNCRGENLPARTS